MLLIYDGLESKYFTESFWSALNPDDEFNDEPEVYGPVVAEEESDNNVLVTNYISELSHALPGTRFSTSQFMFNSKINQLIQHHHKQFTKSRGWNENVEVMVATSSTLTKMNH
jgi:hypothetical protein